ncbi:hypothetical protein ACTFIY_010523 [Dictyostelium cf. discoideum]
MIQTGALKNLTTTITNKCTTTTKERVDPNPYRSMGDANDKLNHLNLKELFTNLDKEKAVLDDDGNEVKRMVMIKKWDKMMNSLNQTRDNLKFYWQSMIPNQ